MLEVEMREVSQAYLGQLNDAVKSSRELAAYLQDTRAFLDGLRDEINEEIQGLFSRAETAENELVARRETVQQELEALASGVIQPMNAAIGEARDAAAQVEEEVRRALDDLREDAENFNSVAMEQASAAEGQLREFTEQVGQLQQQMHQRFDEAGQDVREFSQFIQTTQSHWEQVVQTTLDQIRQAQQECTTTLDNDFISHVADTLQTFDSALHQIDAQVLRDPIGALKSEAKQAIDAEVQAVFDQAVDELTQVIDQLANKILGTGERTNEQRQLLKEIFDQVREFLGPLTDKVGGVRGLAGAAGFSI